MKPNEFYYLVLVIGAFGAFGIGTAISTLHYRMWLKVPTKKRR